jgi:translation initiation factor IF-2
MAGKPIRLGKAAGELNVGMSTLVEFLGSKGIKIDVSPNTKLEEEHYDILRKEFAADQSLKEQSKFSAVKREKRESVSIRDKEEETTHAPQVEEEDSEPISAEEIKRNIIMETPVAKV